MSDSIEDIKFPSDFLAAIDSIHSEATEHYEGISSEAKALAKSRSTQAEKASKDAVINANTASSGLGSKGGSSKSSGPKM